MVICGINRFILAGSLGSSSPLRVSTNLYIERRSSSAVGEDLARPGKIPFRIGATLLFSPSFFFEGGNLYSSFVLGSWSYRRSCFEETFGIRETRKEEQVYLHRDSPFFRSSVVLLVLPASLASKKTFGTQGTRRDEQVYPHGFPTLLSHVHRSMVICGINRFILAGSLGSSSPLRVSTNLYIERRSSSAVGEDLARPGKIPFRIGATLLFSPFFF
ncbi:unnamed protein product [Cuscuta epithymum]|uniref:Uncharacterized protein n=1 Tax=Cuscuta epithymum TaxID=186058 RepID=A0AAV0CU40_9ASTE|nr:unnamed protein product [Cuscuta epithymum]